MAGPIGSFQQLLRGYNTLLLTGVTGAMVWTASQAIDVRDTIHRLNDTVPIQLQALDRRVTSVEGSVSELDRRVDRIRSRNAPDGQ